MFNEHVTLQNEAEGLNEDLGLNLGLGLIVTAPSVVNRTLA